MITYDALFAPLVTLVVEERDGEHHVIRAEVDWDDSFRNTWRNDADGNNEVEVADGDSDAHPAAAEAVARLDGWLRETASDAALLRRLADLIEGK